MFELRPPSVSLQDEAELEQLMKTDNETREVVRELRQKVDEAKSSLSSNRSRGKVLDALMQQKKSGRIPGIYGRLVKEMHINSRAQLSISRSASTPPLQIYFMFLSVVAIF